MVFDAYYNSNEDIWKVIKKDDDGYWFDHIPDAGNEESAKNLAYVLNKQAREREDRFGI